MVQVNNQLQVLVVDDNAASAQTLAWALEMVGCNVKIAISAHVALDITKSFIPHIIITDIGLPDMNGFELCEEMKNIPELKNAIYIAQTGWSEEKYKQKAREVGFHHYLLKPIDLKVLQELVVSVKN